MESHNLISSNTVTLSIVFYIFTSRNPGQETKSNQMGALHSHTPTSSDEGLLKTSSRSSFKPTAHDNLLWHRTLFAVRNSAGDEKPVPFLADRYIPLHTELVPLLSEGHLLLREKIISSCTNWVTRKRNSPTSTSTSSVPYTSFQSPGYAPSHQSSSHLLHPSKLQRSWKPYDFRRPRGETIQAFPHVRV